MGQAMDGNGRFVVLTPKSGIRKDRLHLTRPVKKISVVNKVKQIRYSSDYYYVDDAGKNCKPPTTIWNAQIAWSSMSFKYMSEESTHIEENCVGFKLAYPLQKEMTEMTPDETFVMNSSDLFHDVAYRGLNQFKDDLPEDCFDTYEKAEKRKDRTLAVRNLFNYRNVSADDKTPDTSKPKIMYVDFSVYARKDDKTKQPVTGRALKCNTVITGPNNKELSPCDICGKPGIVQLVIEWLGVNWAPQNSKMAGIIKYKLNQITWIPSGSVSVPRLLSNDSEVSEQESEETEGASSSHQNDEEGENKEGSGDELSGDDDFDDPFAKKTALKDDPEPEPAPAPSSSARKPTAAERRAALQKNKNK